MIAAAALATPAIAEDNRSGLLWMSGEAIRSMFAGQKLQGRYPSQKLWSETIAADGTTDYREGAKHWRGEWWIRDREFCFSYPPPGTGSCFRVAQVSANCFELYDFGSQQGQADLPPRIADLWNGRMWRRDKPVTCEAMPSV